MSLNQRRGTAGAHTSGTESIADEMKQEMLVQGESPKRFVVLAIFALAVYINQIPLFGDFRAVNQSSYIQYFAFFPLFYTSIHWIEQVGLYQTMLMAMVFQTLSFLISKTANEGDGAQTEEYVGQVLSAVAQVYIFNGFTKFTGAWFNHRVRPFATAILLIFAQLGTYTPMWITMVYNSSQPNLQQGNLQQVPDITPTDGKSIQNV